jgi:hypothetical protein
MAAMRAHAISMLVCVAACTGGPPEKQAQIGLDAERAVEQAKPEPPTEPAAKIEPPPTPVEPPPTPVEPAVEPTSAQPPARAPAERWRAGAIAAPSLAKPPPTSVLGQLPKAEAIALVLNEQKLELVAAQPSGWRRELVTGTLSHLEFEPATGLLFFYRDRSVWAIDLLEPLAADVVTPPVVELARRPDDGLTLMPGSVHLCFPPAESETYASCWPDEPLPTDVEPVPEYLEVYWADQPTAKWHVPFSYLDIDVNEDGEEHRDISLDMVGAEWLRARADRRQHFQAVRLSVHAFWQAEPMVNPPALAGRCLDPEDCGKSLPLGTSGWEWVVVGSDQGDLFHPYFAVHDPATKRWTKWEQLTAGAAAWVPTSELERRADELGDETYPLFDGGGRVFANPSHEQLCWFRFDNQAEIATGVTCKDAGGSVVGFLSVSTYLGSWCSYC